MKKLVALIMALFITAILFGCSEKNATKDSGTAKSGTTDNIIHAPIIDVASGKQYEENIWVDVPVNSLRDIDFFFHENGFPEAHFLINEENISGNVKISTNGTVVKINVTYMDSNWDIWAVHIEDRTQPIRLGVADAPMVVRITEASLSEHLSLYDSVLDGLIPIFFDENNAFICQQKEAAVVDELVPPYLFYFDGRDNQEKYFLGVDSDSRNDRELLSFTVNINNEPVAFKYRLGSTWEAWVNSELNTDGWFIPEHLTSVALNADKTAFVISADLVMPMGIISLTQNTSHPWREMVVDAIENGYKIAGDRIPMEDTIPKYRNRFVYCENSNSPLCVTGIEMVSDFIPSTGCNFMLNQGFKIEEPITISMHGVIQENVEHVKVYVESHASDEFNTISENATEVEMSYADDTLTGIYNPSEDANFIMGSEVDVLFTYDGEIVYHVTLKAFDN